MGCISNAIPPIRYSGPRATGTVGGRSTREVFADDGQLFLYFATRDPTVKTQMLGVAVADLKSDFGPKAWKQLGNGPILKPELTLGDAMPRSPYGTAPRQSAFPLLWGRVQQRSAADRRGHQPGRRALAAVVRSGPCWPTAVRENGISARAAIPGVFEDEDGKTYLFYQGNNDHGRTWFLSAVEIDWSSARPGLKNDSLKFGH